MLLFRRDRGVCRKCGLDCEALRLRLKAMNPEARAAAFEELRKQGFDLKVGAYKNAWPYNGAWSPSRVTLWDADHIDPLDEGGSWHPDNAQTLCQPCHKEKTAEQAARRGKTRRMLGWKHRRMQRSRSTMASPSAIGSTPGSG
jgi:hypothetical protein